MSQPAMPPRLDVTKTYAGRIVEILRELVLDGSLPPGGRLNEVHLSQALGISRGPLREAIQRLASEGLVEMVPHRGAFVRSVTASELADLYELRTALETHAVRVLAARVATSKSGAEPLSRLLHETRELMDGEDTRAYPSELDFHAQLVAAAGAPSLEGAALDVTQRIRLARSRSGGQPARARQALDEHHAILAAVLDGDGDTAAALLTAHLKTSLESAAALLEAAE